LKSESSVSFSEEGRGRGGEGRKEESTLSSSIRFPSTLLFPKFLELKDRSPSVLDWKGKWRPRKRKLQVSTHQFLNLTDTFPLLLLRSESNLHDLN